MMLKWTIIIAFNIVFGFLSGFITSRVFNHRDWNRNTWYYTMDSEDKKMILCIALASVIAGIFCYLFSQKSPSGWLVKGIIFGNIVTILTFLFTYLLQLYNELVLRPKPGVVLDTKIQFITELFRSFNPAEFFVLSMFTLLYGWVFFLIPVLGLSWGYITYNFIVRLE